MPATIRDDNVHLFLPDAAGRVTVHGRSYICGTRPRPRGTTLFAATPWDVSGIVEIPESEWRSRLAQQAVEKATLKDLMYDTEPLDQDGYGWCWRFCVCGAMRTAARLMHRSDAIPSAGSMCSLLNRWDTGGGWPMEAVQAAFEDGLASDDLWPMLGNRTAYNTPTANADRKNHHIVTFVDLTSNDSDVMWRRIVSCALQGIPTADTYSWWSHAVEGTGIVDDNGELLRQIRNSWGDWEDNGFGTISKSKAPDECIAVLSVTASEG